MVLSTFSVLLEDYSEKYSFVRKFTTQCNIKLNCMS